MKRKLIQKQGVGDDGIPFIKNELVKDETLRGSGIRSQAMDLCRRFYSERLRDLPPCPFCGGTDLHLQVAWFGDEYVSEPRVDIQYRYWVQCADQGCWVQGPFSSNRSVAITAWKRRFSR